MRQFCHNIALCTSGTRVKLALDLRGQFIIEILGFSVTVRQSEIIDRRAVQIDAFVAPRADGQLCY